MRLPSVILFESFKSQKEVDPDPPPELCVSKSELELQELGCERYGRMSVPVKRMGSSCSIVNAESNSIVKREDTGDGIIELDIGDLMKLDNGDLIEPEVSEEVSPLNKDDDAISNPDLLPHKPIFLIAFQP